MARPVFGWAIALAIAAAVLAAVFSPAAGAQSDHPAAAPDLATIAKRVDRHYNRLHSLRVDFAETYTGMGMKRNEAGTLLLEKPGRMKWSYAKPAGKLFVIDGKNGYAYTPGDAQAERYPAKQLSDFRSPLRYLLGHTQIEKELTGLTMTADGADYRLSGVPKGMAQQVARVDLTVTADGTIRAIAWQQTDGSTTAFRLTGEQANPPVPADAFRFQPPAGVVVVRGMAPI
jgi:outer membrane lipoprotein carrier protein